MIQCPKCHSTNVVQTDANRYECPYCGNVFTPNSAQGLRSQNSDGTVKDEVNILMVILSALIPIVGIIYYFVKKNELPKASKTYLWISIVMWIIYICAVNS